MTVIIGICGQLGSGKDTASDHLVDQMGYQKIAFAEPIKEFAQNVFGFTDEQVWGPSENRNTIDPRFSEQGYWLLTEECLFRYGPEWIQQVLPEQNIGITYHSLYEWFTMFKATTLHVSPRLVLQSLGTEWGRTQKDSIWVDILLDKAKSRGKVIASDVRFINEAKALQERGGKLLKIRRPLTDTEPPPDFTSHRSETEQQGIPDDMFDAIITNTGTLNEFYTSVEQMVAVLELG